MQKALSSDLKTAAAPAGKKYPSRSPCQTSKNILSFAVTETFGKCPLDRRDRNFRKYPLDRLSRNSQKISVSPVMIQPSKNIRLARRAQTSKNILSLAVAETFGKYLLNRLSRNSQKNPPHPPYPKLSEISPSPAYPKLSKKTYSCPPCPKAENFHILYML